MLENRKLDQKMGLLVIMQETKKEDMSKKNDLYKDLNTISFRLSLERLNTFYVSDKKKKKRTA